MSIPKDLIDTSTIPCAMGRPPDEPTTPPPFESWELKYSLIEDEGDPMTDEAHKAPEPSNMILVVSHDGKTGLFINGIQIQFASLTLRATPGGNTLECVLGPVDVEIVERRS